MAWQADLCNDRFTPSFRPLVNLTLGIHYTNKLLIAGRSVGRPARILRCLMTVMLSFACSGCFGALKCQQCPLIIGCHRAAIDLVANFSEAIFTYMFPMNFRSCQRFVPERTPQARLQRRSFSTLFRLPSRTRSFSVDYPVAVRKNSTISNS
jgi:hypothetical protein